MPDTGAFDGRPRLTFAGYSMMNPLRLDLVGLSVECPFDGTNPCTCPLHEIRKKTLRERYEWAQKLNKSDALSILFFHQDCLKQKETFRDKARSRSPE